MILRKWRKGPLNVLMAPTVTSTAAAWKRLQTLVLCARNQLQWLLFTVHFRRKFRVMTLKIVATKIPSLTGMTTEVLGENF